MAHTYTHTHAPGSQPISPPSFSSNHTNCAFQTFHFKTTKTIAFKLKKDHCGEIAEDNICVSFSPSAYDQEVHLCLTYNSCPSFKWQQVKRASCFKPQRKWDIKRNKDTIILFLFPTVIYPSGFDRVDELTVGVAVVNQLLLVLLLAITSVITSYYQCYYQYYYQLLLVLLLAIARNYMSVAGLLWTHTFIPHL